MNNCRKRTGHPAVTSFISLIARWLPALVAVALLGMALPARALEADEWYLQVYGIIERADELNTSGQAEKAKAKYVEAEKALKNLKQNYPNYNPKLIAARQSYLSGKIATLSQPPPVIPSIETTENKSAAPIIKPVVPGQPQVKLLEAGAEPRQVFRLHAKPLALQKVTHVAKVSMGMSMPETPGQTMKMPAISMKSVITPKSVSSEGDVNYEIVIEGVDVNAEPGMAAVVVDGLKQSLAGLKGLVLVGTMTDRYLSKKLEAKIPPGTDVQTREGMEEMKNSFMDSVYILPEEAIGVGAKWEIKKKTKVQGMMIDQATRLEVVAIEGGSLILKTSTTQSAANQKIANPIMPALKVDMTKMTGTRNGTATVDLTKILATKVTEEERSELNMSMNNAGKKQIMTMKTETHATLESD